MYSNQPKKLLAEGEATFEVIKVFKKDKEGNDLFTGKGDPKVNLMLLVRDRNNQSGSVYETFTPNMAWKLEAICKSVGRLDLLDGYDANFDYDRLIGTKGLGLLIVQDTPPYTPKNVFKKFIEKKEEPKEEINYPDDDLGNIGLDEVPF